MKKRLLSWFMAMIMVLGLLPMTAWAENNDSITANVTIADKGVLQVAHKEVTVTDQNANGTFDVDDVLYAAHEAFYAGDAESGYHTYTGQYGLSIGTLWGDTSGAFGYYVNDASAWSLTDEVKNGDKVVAFVYKDQTGWSDQYSFFDKSEVSIKTGEELTLTLSYQYWDGSTNATSAVSGAAVKVNGEATETTTTTAGEFSISFDKEDKYVVSATSDEMTIVPPVCVVTVTDAQTPDSGAEGGGNIEDDDASGNIGEDVVSPEQTPADINILLKNIAASYADNAGEWVIMDMAAYEDLGLDSAKSSDAAKQNYINAAIASLNGENVGETTYTKAILALTAIGIDAEKLYPENSAAPISAIAGLNALEHGSSAWVAPYTLAAYNQMEYENTAVYENEVIAAVLANQQTDGSWSEWGDSIQTTSNMIAGLAFYYDTNAEVKTAVDKAVAYLSGVQKDDGSFDAYGYGADANTMAMVVIALSALGINPDTDARFIKHDASVLDVLLSFALADNSGFGYADHTAVDSYSTEQAFRALIAAYQVLETGKACNIYDFSHNAASLQPGYVKEVVAPDDEKDEEKNEEITVEVSIKAIGEYWLKNKDVTVEEGATVCDAFLEAIEDTGIEQKGAKKGYIESMTYGGETLGEFDEGENSGWLYKVNGDLPDVGIDSYELEDGDEVLFYYTQDWKKDPDAGSRYEEEIVEEEIIVEEVQEETLPELPVLEEIYTDISADSYYYEAVQWAVAKGIVSGVTDTEFGADQNCSRGQLMTFLWRMMGSPAPATLTAPYIDVEKDMYYHDAILWATENALANGTDDISFSPEMTLTRGQAVTFLWRVAGMPVPAGEIGFADVSKGQYYWKAVLWAAENGITSGTGDGMFSPDAPCTRGQIMTFLCRYFGK